MIKEFWKLIKMLFATHPSDFIYKDMDVIDMRHFPFKGYKAMSWCGRIIHRIGSSEVNDKTIAHEKIHLMQAVACNDSWIRYYLSYAWNWLRHGLLTPISANYYVNKYESEAYANDEKTGYCDDYDGSNLKKYKIKNAKKLYKQLGGTSKEWKEYVKTL